MNAERLGKRASPEPGPADVASRREEAERLQEIVEGVLASVSPQVVRAWRLRVEAGLNYAAIADSLGVPPGTAASLVYRARHALRVGVAEAPA